MDLAMPGIDGWETLRRLREVGVRVPAAVVSANAFDRKLDNPVGLPPEDFIVKPVRLPELLDWLGARLALQWVTLDRPAPEAVMPAAEARVPPAPRLQALQQALDLGHVRGIGQQLDAIEAADPAHAAFVARLRAMARQYRFDAMTDLLKKALDERPA
jgi:CheY-like chemotaxis protein